MPACANQVLARRGSDPAGQRLGGRDKLLSPHGALEGRGAPGPERCEDRSPRLSARSPERGTPARAARDAHLSAVPRCGRRGHRQASLHRGVTGSSAGAVIPGAGAGVPGAPPPRRPDRAAFTRLLPPPASTLPGRFWVPHTASPRFIIRGTEDVCQPGGDTAPLTQWQSQGVSAQGAEPQMASLRGARRSTCCGRGASCQQGLPCQMDTRRC